MMGLLAGSGGGEQRIVHCSHPACIERPVELFLPEVAVSFSLLLSVDEYFIQFNAV